MKKDITLSSKLSENDFTFLARKYEVEKDFLRTLNDKDWCDFLVCSPNDLEYFLFEDDNLPMALGDSDDWDGIFDDNPLDYIEEVDDYERSGQVTMDIDSIMAKSVPKQKPLFSLSQPKVNTRPVCEAAKYRKPSPMAKKSIVVNHHFEIVR